LGLAAALSLASSIGATFLTRDSSLRPVLIVTLAVTTLGTALTFWRHRSSPVPLLFGAVAVVGAAALGTGVAAVALLAIGVTVFVVRRHQRCSLSCDQKAFLLLGRRGVGVGALVGVGEVDGCR